MLVNVAKEIQRAANLFPDKEAIIFEERRLTYRDLWKEIRKIATGLQRVGMRTGDRAAIFLGNVPEFIVSYFAAQAIGAIAVVISPRSSLREVAYIIHDTDPRAILSTVELFGKVQSRLETPCADTKRLIIFNVFRSTYMALETPDFEEPTPLCHEMDWHSPAAIFYTSGTTGRQKGAVLSQANLLFHMRSSRSTWGISQKDRVMMFLPVYHSFGDTVVNATLSAGATVILHRYFNIEECVSSVERNRVTMFFGVPTVYIKILNAGIKPSHFSPVRFYFSSGASLPVRFAKSWQEKFGRPINEGYGLTEAVNVTYNHRRTYKPGSIGSPVRRVEIRVVSDTEVDLPAGKPGEILVRGPNVMLGYWNRPEDTAEVLSDNGWLHTGDIGYVDADGYYYLVDRMKEMINVSGFKVWPHEVEDVLYMHPAVQECAVVGVADPVKGETVKAFVVTKPHNNKVTGAELEAYCREHLAPYMVPKQIEFVQDLPKSSSGKILKRELV